MTKRKEEKPAGACTGCPWRRINQSAEAVRSSPRDGAGIHWFDPANLKGHWKGVANGQMLPCHETDRNAPLYGGKAPRTKLKPRICVGVTVLARREVTAFMAAGNDFARYSKRGESRMTLFGLAAWATRLVFSGAIFDIGRDKLQMPEGKEDSNICFPWPDDLNPNACATDG